MASAPTFPALEVMTVGPHGLPVGRRLPITERFILGRGNTAGLSIASSLITRVHCEVVFELGRWWVRDLGSTNGTFVGGEPVHDAQLNHGDCFELPWGVVFRLLLREPVEARDEAMERALFDTDDPRQWSVYGDWLQERGDPLGARLSSPRPEDDPRWLGPLAGDAGRGELQVRWACGLPREVVLRCLTPHRAEVPWEQRLATLQRQREFRFVRSLELDLGSFFREPLDQRVVSRALVLLDGSLPALERFVIGPASLRAGASDLTALLRDTRRLHPRLVLEEPLVRPWQRATLTLEALAPGLTSTLQLGTPVELGAHASFNEAQFQTPGPLGGFSLRPENDRWFFEALDWRTRVLRLNGRDCARAQLRDADLIEPAPGLALRFRA